MHGSLDAESVVGEGSRFRVRLPLPRANEAEIAEGETSTGVRRRHRGRDGRAT